MAAKRTATTELTHENWDIDDEREEAGTFQQASENVLKNRVIKRAVRRNPISSVRNVENDDKKNVFGNFTFNKNSASNSFDFLNKPKNVDDNKSNGLNNSSFKLNSYNSNSQKNANNDINKDYFAKLKGLNQTASDWIKKHVDENPFINLSPIFKDYEKYFKELEETKHEEGNKLVNKTESLTFQKITTNAEEIENTIAFKTPEKITSTEAIASGTITANNDVGNKPAFTFGMPTSSTSNINFGSNTSKSPNFTFGGSSSTPCTFQNVAAPSFGTKSVSNDDVEDEEDEPPKVEFKEVEEEGHIYKIRCKVYVKKKDAFTDKGVGNLFLKPIPDSEKVQLIVRADTNLGNLLCNFILSETLPIQKKGKKDVLIVCLPTPDYDSPVPLLLRVKTPEDAEKLFQELEKNKR